MVINRLETVYDALRPMMDERLRRQWVAVEAQAYGWAAFERSARPRGVGQYGAARTARIVQTRGQPRRSGIRARAAGRGNWLSIRSQIPQECDIVDVLKFLGDTLDIFAVAIFLSRKAGSRSVSSSTLMASRGKPLV